jgi:hypothetical protein
MAAVIDNLRSFHQIDNPKQTVVDYYNKNKMGV